MQFRVIPFQFVTSAFCQVPNQSLFFRGQFSKPVLAPVSPVPAMFWGSTVIASAGPYLELTGADLGERAIKMSSAVSIGKRSCCFEKEVTSLHQRQMS